MKNDIMALRRQQSALVTEARNLHEVAATESRDLTEDESTKFNELTAQAESVGASIKREEHLRSFGDGILSVGQAPAINRTGLGDTEARATAHYLRTGDGSGLAELRASNATDLNIGTPADGGYAVPTGHYNNIIAKRDSVMLADKLGVLRVPGTGAVTNVPVDNGTANVFVATTEASDFDLDGPALGQAQMTLVWYTKRLPVSYQLLAGEDSKLLSFIENYVGRAYGLTHNALLVTEALASGTSVTLAAAAAATAGDPQTVAYSLKGEYAEGAQWIMKRATDGSYRKLTGNPFSYGPTGGTVDSLWNYPINWSESVAAIGAGTKSIVFGNFAYMGLYEAPALTFLRDPYSLAAKGQVQLLYHFAAVYKVTVAEAILYGKHPTA
jgi:HK97 family phage major capsid protein